MPRRRAACQAARATLATLRGGGYQGGMIIAIDGPAASGKGTLARRLAGHLGYVWLDTGKLYRAVGLALLRAGRDPGDAGAAVAAARALAPGQLDDPALRGEAVGEAASRVAAIPQVRAALLDLQREIARTPPGAVLDGRDIGSVVCPDADLKIFVTAPPEIRARRRWEELRARGERIDEAAVLADIRRRDARDSGRADAPLAMAPDAVLLDTGDLDIDAVFARALAMVEEARAS